MSIALTIAGSDPSGGAGIQADIKTFSALGVYGASAITALTAQNTQGVRAVYALPPDFVRAQIAAVMDDLGVRAIKIGMLANAGVIAAVDEALQAYGSVPVVLDPVMVATSGDLLLMQDAIDLLKATLLRRADLVTPNLNEAAWLTAQPLAETDQAMERQASQILALGAKAVLMKGGHGQGDEARDFFTNGVQHQWFSAPRHATRNTHGTGCTLSSAIAAGLAKGENFPTALAGAKAYISAAIAAADRLVIGQGNGPVHHFHALWK